MAKAIKKNKSSRKLPKNKLTQLKKEINLLKVKLSDPKTPSSSVNSLRSQIAKKRSLLKSMKGSGSGSVKRPPAHPIINMMGEKLLDKPAREKRNRKNG